MALVALSAGAARADGPGRLYLAAGGGSGWTPRGPLEELPKASVAELAAGWRLGGPLAIELAIGRQALGYSGRVAIQQPVLTLGHLDDEFVLVPMRLRAQLVLPVGPVELRARAGAGVLHATWERSATDGIESFALADDVPFLEVGAGVGQPVAAGLTLGLAIDRSFATAFWVDRPLDAWAATLRLEWWP